MQNYYSGSTIFSFISDVSGLPIDQVNFIITQWTALALAPMFRTVLHPSKTSPDVRHGFGLVLGLLFGYICFGMQTLHLAGLPITAYFLMRTLQPEIMPRIVLTVSLIYLSSVHLYRQFFDYGGYNLDITGPLMVITQKVTTLAFSLHDGLTRDERELSESQRYNAIKRIPTPLEYFSYVFHHQTLMAGPILFYKDYIDFINGTHFKNVIIATKSNPQNNNSNGYHNVDLQPSATMAVVKKVVGSVICALIYLKLIDVYSIHRIAEDEFVNDTSIIYKLFYLYVATTLVRFKYYHAWLLADGICNHAGIGFNGYNTDGTPRWDKISNIDVLGFEFGLSLRDGITAWNKGTNQWLRMIVYERVKRHGTILTYALSAVWHGFYLGYYLTFASGALFTIASRSIRRSIRGYFMYNPATKRFYDFLTWFTTRIIFGYITFPFVILEFWPSIRLYLHMYLCLHILGLLAIVVLPRFTPKNVQRDPKVASETVTLNHSKHTATVTNGVHKHHSHRD